MKKILASCFVILLLVPLQIFSTPTVHVRGLEPEWLDDPEIAAVVANVVQTVETLATQQVIQGQITIPFMLVDFPDLPLTRSKADFEQLFNQLDLHIIETPDGFVPGSLRDYFLSTSFGKLDLTVNIYGPFRMPEPVATYEWTPPAWGGHSVTPHGPIAMVREAIRQATSEDLGADRLNFADYDLNGEGFIQHLHLIFAGHGVGTGGITGQHINPHAVRSNPNAWTLATVDGIVLHGYSVTSEFKHINQGIALGDIGTVVHELGHSLFNLPDLYGVPGNLERWCVMGTGLGQRPSHFSAWSRVRMGWVEPIVLDSPQIVTLPNPADGVDVVYRINTATPNEFFLLENRQQNGWDADVHGSGLIIYHVDDATTGCVMCDPNRRRVYVKQASGGLLSLNADRTTDTWPQWGRTNFTDYTVPNALSWAGEPTNKPIVNITQHDDGRISFRFMMEEEIPEEYNVNFALVAPTVVHGSSERNVGVRFYNLGQPITDAVIEWTVDDVPQEPYTWSGHLDFETEMTVLLGTFYFANDTHAISIRVQIADATIDTTLHQITTVTRPFFFENFEGDVSSWRLANGATVNRWMIGNDVSSEGHWSAYISNDSATNQSDEAITTRFIHLFHQVSFPKSDEDFELYFDVRGTGTLEVRTTGLFNPSGGSNPTALPQARLLGRIGDVANWETVMYTLPAERYSGQTFNLIFTWDMGGVQPPKAIDNIAIIGPYIAPDTIPEPEPEPDTIPSSITDAERLETFLVFPNPVTDKLQLTIDNLQFGDVINIFDINGRLVFSKPICQLSVVNCQLTIDVSHLPNGPYIVRFRQSSTRIIKH